jgi:hypothetical protein
VRTCSRLNVQLEILKNLRLPVDKSLLRVSLVAKSVQLLNQFRSECSHGLDRTIVRGEYSVPSRLD